jgi:NAD(P)-dependent dehydrogenase (short-subunit alcohol dehydrogenase family)
MMPSARTIVLTGATRGLGLALSEAFVEDGHTVIGCGRSQNAVDELRSVFPDPHRFTAVDIAEWPQVQEWAATTLEDGMVPDLVINNAGLMNPPAPLWRISANDFEAVMRVNVDGTANVIRAFLPAMIVKGTGVVINMSSGWGRSTAPEVAPYCASKWAIEGLTRALAQELPKGLAAVAVNPGIIDTEMLRECWSDAAASFPSPEEWVRRARPFLLSLSARHNGQSVSIG